MYMHPHVVRTLVSAHHHTMVRHGGACVCAMVVHDGVTVVSWWWQTGVTGQRSPRDGKEFRGQAGQKSKGEGGTKGPIDGTTDRIGIPPLSGTNPDRHSPKSPGRYRPATPPAPGGESKPGERARIGMRIIYRRKRESLNWVPKGKRLNFRLSGIPRKCTATGARDQLQKGYDAPAPQIAGFQNPGNPKIPES